MSEEREHRSLAFHLTPWAGPWHADDPNARFKEEVALFSRVDPLPALQVLAEGTGVPVGGLLRFIATKYLTAGSEALLAVGVAQIEHLLAETDNAETLGTTEARLHAYWNLRGRIRWLVAGLDPPDPRAPWDAPDHDDPPT